MDHRPGTSSGGGGGGVGTGSGGGASDSTGTITGLGGGVGGATTGRHGRERSGSNADNTDAASVRSVGTSLTGTTSIIGGGTGTGVGVGTGGAGVAPSEGGRSSRSVMGVGSVGSGSGPTYVVSFCLLFSNFILFLEYFSGISSGFLLLL